MIIFRTIRYKNFLSTGNKFTEINLTAAKSTLIVGTNGAGKSTLLDALSFGLFGKAHRNVTKPQLVNTINNKDCVVEVEFQAGASVFKIIRGLKPSKFEIWKDGQMLDQSSHAKEYQKILEQNILKMTHKSFHQIVVLGSSSFIPFMQLPTGHRRNVIEDLLDINVFSNMNVLLKTKQSALKDTLGRIEYDMNINSNSIDAQNKYIRDLTALNNEEIEEKKRQIDSIQGEIARLEDLNDEELNSIDENHENIQKEIVKTLKRKTSIVEYKATFTSQIAKIVKDAQFYSDNTTCPTCTQEIQNEVRETKLADTKNRAKQLNLAISQADSEIEKLDTAIRLYETKINEINEKQSNIRANNQEIRTRQSMIDSMNKDIERLLLRSDDLETAKAELNDLISNRTDLEKQKFTLNEEYGYNVVIAEMLKDTGIKTKIIKQYLPIINKLVNRYLTVLDFFVHFNLDEEFKEEIRSRHRDSFSYDSFSEGEKQRIDLALLFTWRMVAKMKNSIATNLLVLDETFDASLDHDGVDNLIKILYTLDDDTNTFVISHKGEMLEGKFDRRLEFVKDKNFSIMKM